MTASKYEVIRGTTRVPHVTTKDAGLDYVLPRDTASFYQRLLTGE